MHKLVMDVAETFKCNNQVSTYLRPYTVCVTRSEIGLNCFIALTPRRFQKNPNAESLIFLTNQIPLLKKSEKTKTGRNNKCHLIVKLVQKIQIWLKDFASDKSCFCKHNYDLTQIPVLLAITQEQGPASWCSIGPPL